MPQNKQDNLKARDRFLKLQNSKEKELLEIVEMAADICNAPYAEINMLSHQRQYLNFSAGIPVPGGGFENTESLITNDGVDIGVLCVFHSELRILDRLQLLMLKSLSKQIIHVMEFDENLSLLKDQFLDLKNSESTLQAFFESSSSCHLLLDDQLQVVSFNKALSNFIFTTSGINFTEEMEITDYVHQDFLSVFKKNCYAALEGASSIKEIYLEYITGRYWWFTTFDPAYNSRGEIIGVSYHATDITKKIEHEEQLRQQDESLQRIAHIQANDLSESIDIINLLSDTIVMKNIAEDIQEIQLLKDSINELNAKNKIVTRWRKAN